jgi:hypothetical protein
MSIEAMKQALEALEYLATQIKPDYEHSNAITSLRQAIARAEHLEAAVAEQHKKQEPVMGVEVKRIASGGFIGNVWWIHENLQEGVFHLYTHPQPKREPLTIEQLREHWQVAKVLDMTDAEIDFADYVLIARDVEALHGIKGE